MRRHPSYPAYRASGVNWLGNVPAHWGVERLKYVAPESRERLDAKPSDLPYLGLENIESKTGRLLVDVPTEDVASTVVTFRVGDVLFGKLRPYLAKVVQVDFAGVGTTELLVLRPTTGVCGRYLYYHLLADGFIASINALTYGTKMPRANSEQVGNMRICLPPLPEQRAIADFLDRETARIDALIAKKQRLIELLQEKRTALISHAVTKGLDAGVAMKESEVPWLGQVPAHWAVQLVKRYYQVDLGKMLNRTQETGGHSQKPYLRAANVRWEGIDVDDVNEMEFSPLQLERYRLTKGDLLITEGGVTVGRSAIWNEQLEECYYQNSLNRARSRGNASTKLLYYWMYFLKENGFIDIVAEKSTFGHLTNEKANTLPLVIPPEQEASEITRFLDDALDQIATITERVTQVIAVLQEYRTALISAAVTGKIDVREEKPITAA